MVEPQIINPPHDFEQTKFDFHSALRSHRLDLRPLRVDTLQANITKLCNQACRHCHVDAGPLRTEQMERATVDRCLEILAKHETITTLDITGGAPELNPHFDDFVRQAVKLNKHVIVRHNLTVTFDGNPQTGEGKQYLPAFFAEQQVEVISSLPYYQPYFTDQQRGRGVFEKSIESLQLLNAEGYGKEGTGLLLNLVYNPVGAFLPAAQASLEEDFKRELLAQHSVVFNNLFTITNMPIHRFKDQLERLGSYEEYMAKLVNAFNPVAAQGIMCRSLISVGYDGRLYDCDFNQMLDMQMLDMQMLAMQSLEAATEYVPAQSPVPLTIFNADIEKLVNREIKFDAHCFGCTAGSGSSCGGATT